VKAATRPGVADSASGCVNPGHAPVKDGACPQCYAACEAELTALGDRYMRLLSELGDAQRRVRDAESDGRVPIVTNPSVHGWPRWEVSGAGIELAHGTSVLQARPRCRKADEDTLVLSCLHRTTGGLRSILMERPMAEALHRWLGQWLAEGWPGVPRRCGVHYRPDRLRDWQCDQEPAHGTAHEGPAVIWDSRQGKPGRESWPLDRPRKEW
jgi:hypothetical protein